MLTNCIFLFRIFRRWKSLLLRNTGKQTSDYILSYQHRTWEMPKVKRTRPVGGGEPWPPLLLTSDWIRVHEIWLMCLKHCFLLFLAWHHNSRIKYGGQSWLVSSFYAMLRLLYTVVYLTTKFNLLLSTKLSTVWSWMLGNCLLFI